MPEGRLGDVAGSQQHVRALTIWLPLLVALSLQPAILQPIVLKLKTPWKVKV